MKKYTKPIDILNEHSKNIIYRIENGLNLIEMKFVSYIISIAKPEDTGKTVYEMKADEICEVCKIDFDEEKVIEIIEALSSKTFWIDYEDKMVGCQWLYKPVYEYENHSLKFRLDEDVIKTFC